MLTTLLRWLPVHLFSMILISWCGSTAKAAQKPETWHLVRIPDPVARRAAIDALEAASARFADAECSRVLTDFEDGDSRSLADQLSSIAVDIQAYLRMVTFIDDTRHPRCASGVLAITAPGSRVVRICADELKRINPHKPEYVVASFIHEILHTLGLGENPPSSREITERVLARCGRT